MGFCLNDAYQLAEALVATVYNAAIGHYALDEQ